MNSNLTLADWLQQAPFTLAMSSGFFGFFTHCGVLNALIDSDIRPVAAMGSSAGALTVGLYASGLEPADMKTELFNITREDFWDPRPGLGVLRGRRFRQIIQHLAQAERIEECRIPLSLSVYDTLRHKTVALKKGDLARAIQASCTVPIMFHPVWINRRPYLDGGILDRPGIYGAAENERIFYHHLASKSAWRGKQGAHTKIPLRENMVSALIENPPRPSPFDMETGKQAYQYAYEKMMRGLEQPVSDIMRF